MSRVGAAHQTRLSNVVDVQNVHICGFVFQNEGHRYATFSADSPAGVLQVGRIAAEGRAGVEIRQYRPAQYDPGTPNGNLSFDGRFTGADATHIGNPVADLVFGVPYTATVTQLVTSDGLVTLGWNQYQAYLQDDYKITPKLTLNLGMRYEYQLPFREVHGLANVWD
ncbi:MAG: TonB-dependent receptor plug [Acidobacteriaceae bacterium]|nr:TonB-dependent receptor plug [Acidobacteriaceae bacterium]